MYGQLERKHKIHSQNQPEAATANICTESNEKAMNRNWSNQKTNPALKTKMGNNQNHK